jgi:hypothetical protein
MEKTMFRFMVILVVAAAMSACGTSPYHPQEYALRDGLIPKIKLNGVVKVGNAQPSTSEVIVYSYGGTQLASNYKDITQLMVDQTTKEIAKNAKDLLNGKEKKIDLKVNHLQSNYVAFYWKSEIKFTAILGTSETIEKTVTHASGNPLQDLNGCIAEGVMNLLNDPKVLSYLAE